MANELRESSLSEGEPPQYGLSTHLDRSTNPPVYRMKYDQGANDPIIQLDLHLRAIRVTGMLEKSLQNNNNLLFFVGINVVNGFFPGASDKVALLLGESYRRKSICTQVGEGRGSRRGLNNITDEMVKTFVLHTKVVLSNWIEYKNNVYYINTISSLTEFLNCPEIIQVSQDQRITRQNVSNLLSRIQVAQSYMLEDTDLLRRYIRIKRDLR